MSLEYRKPGVYVEERLRTGSSDVGSATSVCMLVGAAHSGPLNEPVVVGSWSEYVQNFGTFGPIKETVEGEAKEYSTYLPYAVYSYFQNGGRPLIVTRAGTIDLAAHPLAGKPSTILYSDIEAAAEDTEALGLGWFPVAPPADGDVLASGEYTKSYDGSGWWTVTRPGHELSSGELVLLTIVTSEAGDVGHPVLGPMNDPGTDGIPSAAHTSSFPITRVDANTFRIRVPGSEELVDGQAVVKHLANNFYVIIPLRTRKLLQFVTNSTGDLPASDAVSIEVYYEDDEETVFTLRVLVGGAVLENFTGLTVGDPLDGTGLRNVLSALNDPFVGSQYVTAKYLTSTIEDTSIDTEGTNDFPLIGGINPTLPGEQQIVEAAQAGVNAINQPIVVNATGYVERGVTDSYTAPSLSSSSFPGRNDVFIVHDACRQRLPTETPSQYSVVMRSATALGANTGDSYVASYGPWIVVPNPSTRGVITIPPGGAVCGVLSRIDSTVGAFRAPAGFLSSLSNALGVDTEFTDSGLGLLNARNVNIIRPTVAAGVTIMGARTRKLFGVDRYVNARRTLIFLRESLRGSTEYAVFENNDERLWADLRDTADRILRPLWENGGLRGSSSAEAYFIKCDSELNTPQSISSGEVRMEVGVALQTPAEFIIIRITQIERGGSTTAVVA